MKKNQPNNPASPALRKALRIQSLDELQKLVDAPLLCAFELDGQLIELDLRRVTPAIEEQRREILRAPQVPWVKERNGTAVNDYDPMNPAYLKAKDLAERKARALIVYACCPAVAAKKPGLTNPDDILRFVQSILAENILDVIALTALASGLSVEVAGRANFTSVPGSAS